MKQGAAPDTTEAEFGERFFRDVVAKDRRDLTIPPRFLEARPAALGQGGQQCNSGTKRQ